jgi:hypothetical protein
VRALPAGEDAHAGGPGCQVVPGRVLAEQAGQLGDVCFVEPAPHASARVIGAGLIGAPGPGAAARVDGDLPGLSGDGGDRLAFPGAQGPADGVGQLPAGPGRELVPEACQSTSFPVSTPLRDLALAG